MEMTDKKLSRITYAVPKNEYFGSFVLSMNRNNGLIIFILNSFLGTKIIEILTLMKGDKVVEKSEKSSNIYLLFIQSREL